MSQCEDKIVQNKSIGELRSVDNTHDDEVENVTGTQATKGNIKLRSNRKRNYRSI